MYIYYFRDGASGDAEHIVVLADNSEAIAAHASSVLMAPHFLCREGD